MRRKASLLRLWLVTAALWVAALLLRAGATPHPAAHGLWLGLLAPPLVLGAVLGIIAWFPSLLRLAPRSADQRPREGVIYQAPTPPQRGDDPAAESR
jgi:hypothetical protein